MAGIASSVANQTPKDKTSTAPITSLPAMISIFPQHLRLRETFNRQLTLSILLITFSQFNFGFDQQGFAATQAMNSFAKQFGEYDLTKNVYYLPTVWLSMFNGINFLGQAAGGSSLSRFQNLMVSVG
jgi:hypothetical protein